MTKRSIHQENLTIVITYASNTRVPEYIEKILIDLNILRKQYNDGRGLQYSTFNNRIDHSDRKSRKIGLEMYFKLNGPIYTEHSFQQQNLHSSQMHTEHSPR